MNQLNINLTNSWENAQKLKHKQGKVFRKMLLFHSGRKNISSIFDRREDLN